MSKRKNITAINLFDEHLEKLEVLCTQMELNRSAVIRRLIESAKVQTTTNLVLDETNGHDAGR